METYSVSIRGRGTTGNPPNRFQPLALEIEADALDPEAPWPQTQFYRDVNRTIIAHNSSPDVGFEYSVNPYRGCEHGCIYCYARPTHEYLDLSAGLDFETKIFVKEDAPQLLRRELMHKNWRPERLVFAGVTDCYQPIERRLEITRGCLRVCAEFRNPVSVITKNHLVTRDIDVLGELARDNAAIAILSVTTLNADLSAKMEPRASVPARRLDAIRALSRANIPTGVMVAPVVPGLTDHEIPSILQACADAGATFCGYVVLRLPFAVKALFEQWLADHFPDRRDKVLNRIRSMRNGKLNDPNFVTRMRGSGAFADQFKSMFELAKRRAGLDKPGPELSCEHFRRPGGQLGLF